MLHDFLKANRAGLIDHCRAKASRRLARGATAAELHHGIPLFLDQLTVMLASESSATAIPAAMGPLAAGEARIADGATRHGGELLRHDYTIDQVVHDYGDLCQSITELAAEQGVAITVEEFGSLNIRLDNAIANAVTEFKSRSDDLRRDEGKLAMNERLGYLAHEMRNLLNTATLAIAAVRTLRVGLGGATGAALDRSLIGMRTLIDRTLAEVRLEAGAAVLETVEIGPFISQLQVGAELEASQKGCELTVEPIEPAIRVEGDHHLLASAVSNILQNAFKFTRPGSRVVLKVRPTKDRVSIEVEDECGGLPPGVEDRIFRPFVQHGADRSGVGLGLPLTFDAVRALGGALHVRNAPGRGCVFIIDLPRKN